MGGPTGAQDIVFTNGTDGTQGLSAKTPAGGAGANFSASLRVTNLNGYPVFIQNAQGVQNGFNGTEYYGSPVGYRFAVGETPGAANVALTTGSFPVLDVAAPYYGNPEFQLASDTYDGNTATIGANDSPGTGNPAGSDTGVVVDVVFDNRMYLLWKYPSGVYYPLAYSGWLVNFYATATGTNIITGPINTIQITNGVSADDSYTRSNDPPGAMTSPIFNGNAHWVGVN